jgi:hypothetical protein
MNSSYMVRSVVLATVLASLATGVTYLANTQGLPRSLRWLETILYRLELPAAFAGIAISHNVHQPDTTVTYVVLFVMYFLVVVCVTALIGWIRRR